MARNDNREDRVSCPVDGCRQEVLARGLYMHIFQTDDSQGKGHYSRGRLPPEIDEDEIKITGSEKVDIDYPDTVEIEDTMYLDTYTGKAYQGKRGLMVHLGQMGGKNNIPEDVTDRHDAVDFPIVEVDDDGNITEVIKKGSNDVPSIEPYLPWNKNGDSGYISNDKIKEFIEEVRNSKTGAVSAEAIERELID